MATMTEPKPLGLREAAAAAQKYLQDLMAQGLVHRGRDIVVEEVDKDDSANWRITLGYHAESPLDNVSMTLLAELRGPASDTFKVFTIHRATGEVLSMKLREKRD